MSYRVFARKWRPRTFEAMAGQRHVLRALTNGLGNQRLHHAYLFTGTRGVGKTTVARILAKCLNCETKGVTAQPCGECDACREIDEGRFIDLIEVDAASRTKVEDTRDLLDNVQYAPSRGRFKIYLVDEVHMLSAHSFNALLKTLEEPPPHVKFLLATTEPQKLPVTVLSRCLQFNLKHLPAGLIAEHLTSITAAEGIEAEPEALRRLARAADGSMRDALSLLDQAVAFGDGAVRDYDVREMLGTLERDFVLGLLEALAAGDGPALLDVVARMAEGAPDFGDAIAELLVMLHRLTLLQTVPEAFDADTPEHERLTELAARLSPEEVQLFYQIGVHGRRDLPLAPDPRTGFEMTMLRMLAFQPVAAADGKPSLTAESSSAAAHDRPPRVAAPATEAVVPAETTKRVVDSAPTSPSDWSRLIEALKLDGMTWALASHCDWTARDGDRVRLSIDEGHRHLVNPTLQERLRKALVAHFGCEMQLAIDVGQVARETPAESQKRATAAQQEAAQRAIDNDPNVAALREAFGAEVVPDSVRPADD